MPRILTLITIILRMVSPRPNVGHNQHPNKKPELAAAKAFGQVPYQFKLRFHVYATRLLFYLIAYEPLRIVMQVNRSQ